MIAAQSKTIQPALVDRWQTAFATGNQILVESQLGHVVGFEAYARCLFDLLVRPTPVRDIMAELIHLVVVHAMPAAVAFVTADLTKQWDEGTQIIPPMNTYVLCCRQCCTVPNALRTQLRYGPAHQKHFHKPQRVPQLLYVTKYGKTRKTTVNFQM